MLSVLVLGTAIAVTAQEKKVTYKKEKLLVNDTVICIVDKKKKGFLEYDYLIANLEEKQLGKLEIVNIDMPVSGSTAYYALTFEGSSDLIQFNSSEFKQFSTGKLLVNTAETLAQIIGKYNLVSNNSISNEAVVELKKEFATNWGETYKTQLEKEKSCLQVIKGAAKSDVAVVPQVSLLRVDSVSKFTSVMIYEIKQNGVLVGVIKAKGSPKSVKEDDAEYDYSPGMMDLNFKSGGPMNYEIEDAGGCIVGRYIAEERMLGTWKDAVQTKSTDIKKYNKEGVKSRLAFMQAFANFLVQKRYL